MKAVNDTRGHGAGDVALRRVAEAMRGRFRSTDILARLAGDEFAVLFPNGGPRGGGLADALIARLATDEVASWGVSVSVGVAPFDGDDTRTAEDVMATADAAMYRAKQRGGAVAELAETPARGLASSRPSISTRSPCSAPEPGRRRAVTARHPSAGRERRSPTGCRRRSRPTSFSSTGSRSST